MPDKFAKVDVWYTQTAKEFRQDVQKTILVYWVNSRISKAIQTREWQGVLIVVGISLLGVLIKGEPQTPIYETVFDNLESIALSSAGVIFLIEIQDRKKRDQYEAWQVINSATRHQTGSGGRIQALQDLKEQKVDLSGVAAPEADLTGIDLSHGQLERANFEGATLYRSNLQGANLWGAHFEKATLQFAQMQEAMLFNSYFEGAVLEFAQMQGAKLAKAQMQRAILLGAEMSKADLRKTNLEGAILTDAQMQEANLQNANLQGALLWGTNLQGAKHITQDQLTTAKLCRTILPDGISLCPNRDCKELGINPKTGLPDGSRTPKS